MSRLGINAITMYMWETMGWLVAGRHFLKFNRHILYVQEKDLVVEITRRRTGKPYKPS
jgi:hypothetical protein